MLFAIGVRAGLPPLQNGDMTIGTERPAGWGNQWIASGKISVARDATIFHSAPASLRVASEEGKAHGQAQQNVDVKGGEIFHIEAWLKCQGVGQALFGVQSYDANWKGLEFVPVGNALAGLDWQRASADVAVPANAAHIGYICMIEGNCMAWFDDVAISEGGLGAPRTASSPQEKIEPPPKAPNAWTPAEGFWKDFPKAWRQTVQGQVDRAKKGGIDIVFIGDSLTQGWDKELWTSKFEPLRAVNFGIGGDGTPQVLWRIEHGILDGFDAKLVVMMIGINNTWPGYKAPATIKGIETCIAAIRAKQPKAKILLLGVLPIFDKDDSVRGMIREINDSIAKLDDGKTIRFLDFGGKFLQPDGSRRAELYKADRLHLSVAGYKVWAAEMEPLFKNMMETK